MPCPVWSIRPLSGGVNIIVAERFSGASPPACRPRLCGNRRSSSHIALFIEGGRVSVAIVADVNFPFPSFPFTTCPPLYLMVWRTILVSSVALLVSVPCSILDPRCFSSVIAFLPLVKRTAGGSLTPGKLRVAKTISDSTMLPGMTVRDWFAGQAPIALVRRFDDPVTRLAQMAYLTDRCNDGRAGEISQVL